MNEIHDAVRAEKQQILAALGPLCSLNACSNQCRHQEQVVDQSTSILCIDNVMPMPATLAAFSAMYPYLERRTFTTCQDVCPAMHGLFTCKPSPACRVGWFRPPVTATHCRLAARTHCKRHSCCAHGRIRHVQAQSRVSGRMPYSCTLRMLSQHPN
jgi:hypothetical protein